MRKNKTDFIPVCIFIVVFGFLFLTGEPTYAGDTFQHENQMIMREPGYALLIQLLRFLSPQKYYWLLIAVQNLLAIVADTMVLSFMRRRFSLRFPESLGFSGIFLNPQFINTKI